jgi:hypothetical protein
MAGRTPVELDRSNRPDAEFPTLRAALDKGAPANPPPMGGDGHRAAFNSAGWQQRAMPRAK